MNIDIPSIVKHICRKGTFVLFETFDQNLDFGRIGFGNLRAFGHQRLLSPSKIVLQAPFQPYHYLAHLAPVTVPSGSVSFFVIHFLT
jgi:hypothetical protein